jgi:transmembrane E3 ubiquitin-protein ligase
MVSQGSITFQDLFDNEREHARLRIEGVYVWPFRQLRMVANRYTTSTEFIP